MGYKQMPLALRVPGLKPTEKLVLIALTDHANEGHDDSTFVGQGRIAAEVGAKRETVSRVMKVLETKGYITRRANFRETEDGRAYRSSDTTTVLYAAMREAVEKAVDNRDMPGDWETTEFAPPSDEMSLPLVTKYHGGSDEKSLPLVTKSHGGSDEMSQLNRELNRELEQGREQGSEIGKLSFTRPASGTPAPAVDSAEDPRYKHTRDAVRTAAETGDPEQFKEALRENFEDGGRLADNFSDQWTTIPAQCAEPWHAGKWLRTFLNSQAKHSGLSTALADKSEVAA